MFKTSLSRRWEYKIIKPHKINESIGAHEVRLINEKGEQMGIMALNKALALSRESGLDLVEVAPSARPPVCRIMDYGKFKYDQAKKEKEARRSQKAIIMRDIRLRPKINEHDLEGKIRMVRRFLEEGNKVKVTMRFRGRESAHPEIGLRVLKNLSLALKDVGMLEKSPAIGGNDMTILIQPVPAKKGALGISTQINKEAKEVNA